MATLTVRDVPEATLARLKDLAARNGRSMSQEVRAALETLAMSHVAACDAIEASWGESGSGPARDEVDDWIRQSRP